MRSTDQCGRRGQGAYHWPNGATYVGSVRDGVRSGDGTLTDGPVTYVGQWLAGQKNGEGGGHAADDGVSPVVLR